MSDNEKEEDSNQNEEEQSDDDIDLEPQEYIFLIDRSGSMYWEMNGQAPAIGMAK